MDGAGFVMHKDKLLFALIALAGIAVFAQSHANKTAAKAASNGPTKVTGKPTKLPDGLEYWDIKVGTGKTAEKGSTAVVNYTGWLTDGKMFDTSVGKEPFPVENLGSAPVI